MDVGIQMIFSTLWLARHERPRGLAGGDPSGAAGRRTRLRRHLVGRASLLRLFVLPGQHAALVVSGAAVHARRPGHGGDHPAVERPAARGGEGVGARSAEQRPGAGSGSAAVWRGASSPPSAAPWTNSRERFDEASTMILEALRTGFIEGHGKFYPQPRIEIRPRPERSFEGPHLCGRLQRGLDRGRRAAEGADADVRRSAVAGASAGDRAVSRAVSAVQRRRGGAGGHRRSVHLRRHVGRGERTGGAAHGQLRGQQSRALRADEHALRHREGL